MTKTQRWRHGLIRTGLTLLLAGLVLCLRVSAADEAPAVVLGRWITAVLQHRPGTSDEALAAIRAMTPVDRELIHAHLRELLRFLDNPDKASNYRSISGSLSLSGVPPITRSEFLERAATLHADAVIFETRPPRPPTLDQPPVGGRGRGAGSDEQDVYVTSTDGEYLSAIGENGNWRLARLLLDDLPPGAAFQTFATTWYHGVTAYLLAHGDFGEAETNLDHATQVMPGSAQSLFDLGCVAETLGMSIFQQVIVDRPQSTAGAAQNGRLGILVGAGPTKPSAKARAAEAASLFERALAIDPHLAEARVRWARLLELDKRWADARRQIGMALSDQPDRQVAFFAHLFGARAANALGDATDADAHLAQALTLFPQAESAILEASDTALTHHDPVLANRRLMSLADPSRDTSPAADPWLAYPLGPGRLPDPPLQALWRAVLAGRH
jgi:tetratricopeptide (TPR) repeat protein